MTKKQTTSEWTGVKGKIMAWVLSSPLRRLETLFFGDYKSAFFSEVSDTIKGDEIILEVGAGSGYFSLAIAKKLKTGKVICLDASEEMLQRLKRRAEKKELKDKIQILKADASSFEIKNESVDLAFSNFVFHEFSSPDTVLAEMFRVLKPGGWIIITDYRRDTWIGRRIAAYHEDTHGPFSATELDALFVNASLNNVKVSQIKNFILAVGKK